ncbi:MAG: hypothetical protein RIQ60_3440 [Pseudomonadota bacterium]
MTTPSFTVTLRARLQRSALCALLACGACGHALAAEPAAPAGAASHAHAHPPGHPLGHGSATQAPMPKGDVPAIRHVLMAMFDKPEARLKVDPVIVEGRHAVADWSQGERGGRALMRRDAGQWQIVLCAGDGLKQAAMLRDAGLDSAAAERLATRLAAAEARLDQAQLARLASFEGVVTMGADGHHPPPADAKH